MSRTGVSYGVKQIDGKPRVSSMSYPVELAAKTNEETSC